MTGRGAARALVALGAALPLVTLVGTLAFGESVTILLRANDEADREEMRRVRDPRDDVAEIYGAPEPGGPVRVMFPDGDRRIVPREDPSRVLYLVERTRGESPLLARTVLAGGLAAGVVAAIVGCLGLVALRRKT